MSLETLQQHGTDYNSNFTNQDFESDYHLHMSL